MVEKTNGYEIVAMYCILFAKTGSTSQIENAPSETRGASIVFRRCALRLTLGA